MSEENEIRRMGGKAQHNSGRGWREKGDAVLEPFLVDVKEYKKSFGLSIPVWRKLCSDAIRSGNREPAFNIVLGETDRVRLWVVDERMFNEMREAWMEKYADV